ncbi:MAG: glycosyltransferase [Clostridium sp.]
MANFGKSLRVRILKLQDGSNRNTAIRYAVNADVFLLPSRWEGLPISLLESMYMKKICVVSNVIGNRDVIHNGKNGFVGEKVEDFVKAIEDCQDEDGKLTVRAYQDILKMYNTKVMAEQYSKKYEMSINKLGGTA